MKQLNLNQLVRIERALRRKGLDPVAAAKAVNRINMRKVGR